VCPNFANDTKPCGSGLARDEALTNNTRHTGNNPSNQRGADSWRRDRYIKTTAR
jgi:hypothetical protein